ncbi:hypothetical protein CYMTET_15436 [Cymbomonas tetramitiformis]|uniref:EF-hand domain-containing protein n=1 Tax=Cymbomonas tetramitiformis TaxID=36881 RepID=A0AAE0GE89_9CHLO|nr:hypothetical protein CYMTET_15436 [Cymbomonas tetramitiformis]
MLEAAESRAGISWLLPEKASTVRNQRTREYDPLSMCPVSRRKLRLQELRALALSPNNTSASGAVPPPALPTALSPNAATLPSAAPPASAASPAATPLDPSALQAESQRGRNASPTRTALEMLFSEVDADGSGSLSADELLHMFTQLGETGLDVEAITQIIREVDLNGDGEIQLEELQKLLDAPAIPPAEAAPHLALNFDVNQTVLMIDSAIGGDASAILNMVLSNTSWGRVHPAPPTPEGAVEGGPEEPVWELAGTSPSVQAPAPDLCTYAQHIMGLTETQGVTDVAEVKRRKKRRRAALQGFTAPGAPGEALAKHIMELSQALRLPQDVIDNADPKVLERLGLAGGTAVLLPSFLHMLRELRKQRRSFSVCFRTFGQDLPKIENEYNALCEGIHPLFSQEGVVKLDGSEPDGMPDMRLRLGSSDGSGTWIRDTVGNLSLVLGTLCQPPITEVDSSALEDFYLGVGNNPMAVAPTSPQNQPRPQQAVEVVHGAAEAAQHLHRLLTTPGAGRTLGLRDYYPGWEATGCSAQGGKPLLLERERTDCLQIFFDDHIMAHDAHIVDVRLASDPSSPPLPIAATLGVHLVRAEPLESIRNINFFLEAIAQAETNWRRAYSCRAKLASALMHKAAMIANNTGHEQSFNVTQRGSPGPTKKYVPHAETELVMLASSANTFEANEPWGHINRGEPSTLPPLIPRNGAGMGI